MAQTGTVSFFSTIDIKELFGVSFLISQWIDDGIHSGNIQIRILSFYPDNSSKELLFQYPSQPFDLSKPGYGFQVTFADMSRIDLKVTAPDPLPITKWACTLDSGCIENSLGAYSTKSQCELACAPPPGESLQLVASKVLVKPGETIAFTATINKPNGTVINLFEDVPLGNDFLVGTGTLQNGKVIIQKTFTLPGTVAYYACTPGLISTCDQESNRITINISENSLQNTVITAAVILGGAYLISQLIANRSK